MAFGFSSIKHAFAAAFHAIHIGAKAVEKVSEAVQKAEPTIEAITGLFDPRAAVLERGAFAILGEVAGAAHVVDDAALVNGLDIHLDAEAVKAVKKLIADFGPELKQFGIVSK